MGATAHTGRAIGTPADDDYFTPDRVRQLYTFIAELAVAGANRQEIEYWLARAVRLGGAERREGEARVPGANRDRETEASGHDPRSTFRMQLRSAFADAVKAVSAHDLMADVLAFIAEHDHRAKAGRKSRKSSGSS